MLPTRANLFLVTVSCTAALAVGGCIAPWSPASNSDIAKNVTARAPATSTPSLPTVPVDLGSPQPDMPAVLDKIQQVRAIDPAAEPRLLDELRNVPPASWPLVAEQFRASLAYHQQLAEKDRTEPREAQPIVDLRRGLHADPVAGAVDPQQDLRSGLAYAKIAASGDDRPSAPIGALRDPHGANSDSLPVLAKATPYSITHPVADVASLKADPAAPAPFASDGPVYLLKSRNSAEADVATRIGDATARPHAATQAVAEMVAAPKRLPLPRDEHTDDNWQQDVQKAIDDLSHRVSQSPTTTAEVHQHVSLRMLRLLAGDTEKALEPIPHISPTEQDYWSRQLFALATYLDHHSQPDDKRRAAASVTHLDEAVANLRELGSLSLRNLSFCKNVYGFGAIEPYENDAFSSGQHVSVYVEVENYHSKSSEKGFCTSLGATYEVLDDKGSRVTSGDFPDVNDCCRSRRRDFHIQFGLSLPENLAPGRYQLQLVVKDRQSDKIGNAKAPFEIRTKK